MVSEELAGELRQRLESEGWTVTVTPEEPDELPEDESEPDEEYPVLEDPPPKPPFP